jgi:hypothetical protein
VIEDLAIDTMEEVLREIIELGRCNHPRIMARARMTVLPMSFGLAKEEPCVKKENPEFHEADGT